MGVFLAILIVISLATERKPEPATTARPTITALKPEPVSRTTTAQPTTTARQETVRTTPTGHRCLQPDGSSAQLIVATARKLGVQRVYHVSTKVVDTSQLLMAFTTTPGGSVRMVASTLLPDCGVRALAIGK